MKMSLKNIMLTLGGALALGGGVAKQVHDVRADDAAMDAYNQQVTYIQQQRDAGNVHAGTVHIDSMKLSLAENDAFMATLHTNIGDIVVKDNATLRRAHDVVYDQNPDNDSIALVAMKDNGAGIYHTFKKPDEPKPTAFSLIESKKGHIYSR